MIKTIMAVIIGLILYDISKEVIKLIVIKKNKKILLKKLNTMIEKTKIDNEFWEDNETKWL